MIVYDPPHFDEGDFVKYEKAEYFATADDHIDSHVDVRLALFIKFLDKETFDACEIYIVSEGKFSIVSAYDLSLLSKNKK